ncbi:MAG: hypothetical protein HY507_00705 [Candidatus Zambryskibacteria bacterium]|nr:hypothetical protein [Candidatus Zambryskibacteria bacterium]
MKVIPRETRKVTYSTEIRNLKKILFNEEQYAFIIGSILGDGCLCENWSKTNYSLLIAHSVKQKDYVFWKYNILRTWILKEPRFYAKNNSLIIKTISHSQLTELRNRFYLNNKKVIPHDIETIMYHPLSLAVWFMDDGNLASSCGFIHGYHLNTQSFTFEENQRLTVMLKNNFGIDCTIQRNHKYYRLFIRAGSKERFKKLIGNRLIESMRYKLG